MIPVLPPAALGQEIIACTVLGASIGALRAVFPARERAAFVLGAPLRAAGGVLQRRVLRPAERRRARRRKARKLRRSAKRTAKKRKKNLPNQRRMMYNSYVLK